ncbi:MAG: low molecular weight protein-tyrosine-phosphatase [Bacteroidota bacterium]
MKTTKVLFVCLGNICRSPAAEGVMKKLIEGLPFEVASAGTAGYHVGDLPDSRMRVLAGKRGYHLVSRARQFDPAQDFEKYDLIVAMDGSNLHDLKTMDRRHQYGHKLSLMTDYCRVRNEKEVPDPYYGGPEGFDRVLDILEDACAGLLHELQNAKS